MSGMMDATNRRGRFTFMLKILDVAFPDRYPNARWPTAYMSCPSLVGRVLSFLSFLLGLCELSVLLAYVCARARKVKISRYIPNYYPTGEYDVLQRNQWDIMASLVRFAKTSESKTHLMYKSNLSFRQVDRYLDLLVERGLLEIVYEKSHSKPRKFFVATNKGRSFLKAYRDLKVIVGKEKV